MANKTIKTITFWTSKEIKQLKTLVTSTKKTIDAVRVFTKTSNRSEKSVQLKAMSIKRELGILRPKKSSNVNKIDKLNTSTKRGVELPGGFVFNFTPKKAEMFENHVRLYF